MSAQLLEGKSLSKYILHQLKKEIDIYLSAGYRAPALAVILLGEDPASHIYINKKIQTCENIGILSVFYKLSKNATQTDLVKIILELNNNPDIDGILVQLPLPDHINKNAIIETLSPFKDVDGFHAYNIGKLAQNTPAFRPCTPYGIMRLLEHYKIKTAGLNAVVIGASLIVGRPLALELLNADSTVTICHSKTRHLQNFIQSADIIISAAGKRNLVKSEWIKPGAIVIDVGIHRLDNNLICGDLNIKDMQEKAGYITPVPGGIGPMTVAMLMENTLTAYKNFFISRN